MARGRLVAINGKTITPDDYAEERAKRLADREFNLSPATTVKADNRIVKGQFWDASTATSQFSFDADVARTLHLDVGDEVTFTVAEQQVKGKITSLRDINWETMQANFYVVAPPTALAGVPSTFITSFKLPPTVDSLLRDLNQNFPSVTVVDVMAILRQIRAVMDKALAAIQFVFMFTLAAGLLVVIAAIRATQSERLRAAAIMKTLGATRQHVLQLTAGEFVILGTLAGLIGTFAANIAAWLIATQAIHIKFVFNPSLALSAIAATVLIVLATASYLVVKIWRQPVADVLREWY
jgi:putative ABC transport system permease protein